MNYVISISISYDVILLLLWICYASFWWHRVGPGSDREGI